jgi:hypothetical protein
MSNKQSLPKKKKKERGRKRERKKGHYSKCGLGEGGDVPKLMQKEKLRTARIQTNVNKGYPVGSEYS